VPQKKKLVDLYCLDCDCCGARVGLAEDPTNGMQNRVNERQDSRNAQENHRFVHDLSPFAALEDFTRIWPHAPSLSKFTLLFTVNARRADKVLMAAFRLTARPRKPRVIDQYGIA
jgi:hypothetical protein